VRPFDYLRPKSAEEAIDIKARLGKKAAFLAGGTDLLVKLKEDAVRPETLIDLSFIESLKEIREADGTVTIGSLASYADIGSSPLIERFGYILRQGALEIGGSPDTERRHNRWKHRQRLPRGRRHTAHLRARSAYHAGGKGGA